MPRVRSSKICPKCGRPGFPGKKTVRNKVGEPYVYEVFGHIEVRNGKRTIKWCYIRRLDGVSKFTNTCQKPKGVSKKQDNLLTPQKLDDLPGRRAHGFTTLGDMKRLGIIISDFSAEELDRLEEESLTRIKEDLHKKVGSIFYHCECGEKINQVDLFLKFKGKCPKCGKQIVKRRVLV